ncbi:MAG: hypothetical protein FJX77_10085, partial [Armatimonadetes bacterium]|nr:hypothetical protein [Armatimonadota bacterium]
MEVKTSADHFVRGDRVPVEIWANYYFGSPVVGGKVTYTLFRDRYWSWWDEEEAYLGPDDVEEGASGEVVDSGELTTDSAGVAKLELATAGTPEEEPGATYTYRIEAEVSDQSERTASGSAQYRVSAGAFSLDVRPESSVAAPGKTMTVEARLLDLADKPVSGVTLSATARLERWERNKLVPEELGRASAATGKDGRAKLAFTLPRTGLVVVTVEARDPRGNPVRETTDIWVTSDAGGDYGVKYPDLAVLLDKKQYAPGENAQVLLNTSKPGGTALLAVEAERVLEYRLVPLKSKSTVVRIPVLHSYLPNVFVHAALVRDGELATSERRLTVRSDAHRLNVTVESDREEYRPGDEATFRVRTTDRAGRPVSAEFSLGVVDEAVYAIRKEPSRGLWETFYPVRQNEVATGFSYPAIYLGDADKAGSNMAVRRNFQDTAHWEPFAKTDTAGRAEVRVRLPDNLTTWRATAVACSMDTQIGKAVDTILVKRELTVRLQTPRAFTEGDQTRVTAVVHNESAGPLDVEVNLKATGLTVEGNPQRSVRVAPGKAEPLAWETRITGPVGPGSRAVVTVSASAGTLADGMELTVPIRPFRREQITGVSGVSRGESVAETIARDAAAVDGELEVRMAPSLAGSLLGALEYLTGYPYGCTEQTMSRFLPDVLVEKALRELELRRPELQAALPAMTQAGLMRLYRFQQSSGGWGWWQYGTDPDPWMTAYVLFGLQEAKAAGVAVNPRVYDSGVSALEGLFQGPTAKADERMFAAW